MLDKIWNAYYNGMQSIISKGTELYFKWFQNQPMNSPADYGKLIGKMLVVFLVFEFVLTSLAKWIKKKLK